MNTKKILIVGGAGFIGSHLAEKYVKEGYLVKVFDDFSSGKWRNINELFNFKNFKLIKGDITKKQLVQEAVEHFELEGRHRDVFWEAKAAERIVEILASGKHN